MFLIRKLGVALLWCIFIALGLKALTLEFSETVGIVAIIGIIAVVDAIKRYATRHKRWFRKRVNILRTICPKSPNDFRMIGDPFFESFYSDNFFIRFKPEIKEFHFCCCIYIITPEYVETWNRAIEDIKAIIAEESLGTKIEIDNHGELGRGFTLIMPPGEATKRLLSAFAHILIKLKASLPYRTNENGILSCDIYFKIKVFDTICYGEYDATRVSKAITISSDGTYSVANGEEEERLPEDFAKSNPPMSIILQYDLYSIEASMLVSKEEFEAYWEKCKSLRES